MSQKRILTNENEELNIQPVSRDALLDEWRTDPQGVIDKADEAKLTFDSYLRNRSPETDECPGSPAEQILWNQGIRMVETDDLPSSLAADLPNIDPVGGVLEPEARMVVAFLDECYNKTLMTGERSAASISALTPGNPWREIYYEGPYRKPRIAPGFNFMDIVAFTRRIREKEFYPLERTNEKGEQIFQVIAESTEPQLAELKRSERKYTMTNFRAGIEATDDFLNDPRTRANDITNWVDELAITHRIMQLSSLGKLVKDTITAALTYRTAGKTVGGVTARPNILEYPFWTAYLKEFGNAYVPNVTIGNKTAITNLELMSMTGGSQNITYGSWAMVPNTNIVNLNGDLTQMAYGWIDDDTTTGFLDDQLYTFQREAALAFVQRMGMDQDEMERVAGVRKTRRWFGTQSLFAVLDENAFRAIDYGA